MHSNLTKFAVLTVRKKEQAMTRNEQEQQLENLQPDSVSMSMATGNTIKGERPSVYLGIDPGLNRTGYAVICRTASRPILIEGGVIKSTRSADLAERIHEIGQGIREIIADHQPDSMAIEQVFSSRSYPQTAVLMAHARGAVLFAAAESALSIMHYTPRQIKKLLTGSGAASKEQVQLAIQRELRLSKILEPNDVADACAVAVCHYHSARVDLQADQHVCRVL